jgi:hypothetical protein
MHLRARTRPLGAAATAAALLFTVACGGSPETPAATPAPAAAPATSPESAPAASTIPTLIEPAEGSSAGHISLFRWAAVDGATGYRMQLNATTDGRLIWESPVLTATDVELPNTVAMEPEGYVWTVTALKGDTVLSTTPPGRFTVTP